MNLVLDAEALSVLARAPRSDRSSSKVVNALIAALAQDRDVVVPAAVLSELYRGGQHDQELDACLSRFPAIMVVDTDRQLAREIGHVLARAGRGSDDHVDASVVAVAARSAGAVIATSDVDGISALTAGLRGVRVEGL